LDLHQGADVQKPDIAEQRIRETEASRLARSAETTLEAALRELDAEDRLILKMRFREGLTVPQISSSLNLDSKRLYRRIERSLKHLRSAVEAEGLTFQQVTEAMLCGGLSIRDDSKGF
jgi:RNA polymerase sigma factor (sigma-70 family)